MPEVDLTEGFESSPPPSRISTVPAPGADTAAATPATADSQLPARAPAFPPPERPRSAGSPPTNARTPVREVPPTPAPPRAPGSRTATAPTLAPVSVERTGFVGGVGQRGRVGTALPVPLVFEVRDTANAPLASREVLFSGSNATVQATRAFTDSLGQARVMATLGTRAGDATVTARTGAVSRSASLVAVPGPAVRLAFSCGADALTGRVTLRSGSRARLEVGVRDAWGNPLPVTALQVVVGDEAFLRVEQVEAGGEQGSFAVVGRRPGATNLAVLASGLREGLTATVAGSGVAGCRP